MEDNIKKVLAGAGFNFKKQFGQNFLTDAHLLDSIVDLSGAEGCDVVEIGCGAGTLTRALAKKAAFVHAYEIDRSLQPVLSQTLAGLDNVEVTFRDFLKLRLDVVERELPPYRVVANLPYYITTPLIMMILEHSNKCLSLTVMVQEEVANRLCAQPDTPDYSAITANIALYATCKKALKVGREMFYPSPNVDSAVVRIDIERGRLGDVDEEMYRRTVQAAFSARRKTLENNLCRAFSLTRGQAEGVLTRCAIDLKVRGEKLSPEEFVKLSGELKAVL
ncbi:MAG TPA: ribosomal RNA small subunit methyltransferase A [Candidatus Coproplasma excrementipullorum]|nr:ribosomal RNA small subunit methyltransferase A [Candidatus Coproplasma excrementipullorum]